MSSSARRVCATDRRLGAGALILGAALLWWRIGWSSFSWDEYVTLMFTQADWVQLVVEFWSADTHRPLYYALQKAWNSVFGNTPTAIRSLAAVLMLATVPVVMGIARSLHHAPAAGFAAVVVVTSPVFLYQGRDARMYCLQTLALMLCVFLVLRLTHRLKSDPDRIFWGVWLGIAVALAVAFYAHSLSLLAGAILALWMITCMALGYIPTRMLRAMIPAALLYACLIAPGFYTLVFNTTTNLDSGFWIPALSPGYIYWVAETAFPYPVFAQPLIPLAILWGLWVMRHQPQNALLIGFLVFGLPLLVLAISTVRPIFMFRSIAWSSLFAMIPIAIGLAALPRVWRWGGLSLFVLLQGASLSHLYPDQPDHIDYSIFETASRSYDPARDVLVLKYQGLEPSLRWHLPEAFTGPAYAFKYGSWNTEIIEQAYHAKRINPEAVQLIQPQEGGRLFVFSTQESLEAPPDGYRDVDAALQAQLDPLTLLQDIHGPAGHNLQIYAP